MGQRFVSVARNLLQRHNCGFVLFWFLKRAQAVGMQPTFAKTNDFSVRGFHFEN